MRHRSVLCYVYLFFKYYLKANINLLNAIEKLIITKEKKLHPYCVLKKVAISVYLSLMFRLKFKYYAPTLVFLNNAELKLKLKQDP